MRLRAFFFVIATMLGSSQVLAVAETEPGANSRGCIEPVNRTEAALNQIVADCTGYIRETKDRWGGARQGRGHAYLLLKKYRQAIRDLDERIEVEGVVSGSPYALRGMAYVGLGKRERGIADLQKGLELDPTSRAMRVALQRLGVPPQRGVVTTAMNCQYPGFEATSQTLVGAATCEEARAITDAAALEHGWVERTAEQVASSPLAAPSLPPDSIFNLSPATPAAAPPLTAGADEFISVPGAAGPSTPSAAAPATDIQKLADLFAPSPPAAATTQPARTSPAAPDSQPAPVAAQSAANTAPPPSAAAKQAIDSVSGCNFEKAIRYWAVGQSSVERGRLALYTFSRDRTSGDTEFLELLQDANGGWRFYFVILGLKKDGLALAKIPEPYLTIRMDDKKVLAALRNGLQRYVSASEDWLPLKKDRIAIDVTPLFAGDPEKVLERATLTMMTLKHVAMKDFKVSDEFRGTYMQTAGLREILAAWKACRDAEAANSPILKRDPMDAFGGVPDVPLP